MSIYNLKKYRERGCGIPRNRWLNPWRNDHIFSLVLLSRVEDTERERRRGQRERKGEISWQIVFFLGLQSWQIVEEIKGLYILYIFVIRILFFWFSNPRY